MAEKMESYEFNMEQSPSSILLEVSQLLSEKAKAMREGSKDSGKARSGGMYFHQAHPLAILSSDDEGT